MTSLSKSFTPDMNYFTHESFWANTSSCYGIGTNPALNNVWKPLNCSERIATASYVCKITKNVRKVLSILYSRDGFDCPRFYTWYSGMCIDIVNQHGRKNFPMSNALILDDIQFQYYLTSRLLSADSVSLESQFFANNTCITSFDVFYVDIKYFHIKSNCENSSMQLRTKPLIQVTSGCGHIYVRLKGQCFLLIFAK